MENDIVSVIIPVFNTEKYVSRCIDSVLNQSYKNIEIILVDNGSSDKSYDICLNYAEQYSNIILCRQSKTGVSNARNMGIEKANGEYIVFLDSDDYVDENMISHLIENMEKNNCDVIGVNYYEEDSNGEKLNFLRHSKKTEIFDIDSFNFFNRGVTAKLFKRKIIHDNRIIFNNKIYYAEDVLFLVEVYCKCKKIVILPEQMYHYVIHEKSAIHKFNHEYNLSELTAWKCIIEKLKGYPATEKEAKCQYCLRAMSLYIQEQRYNCFNGNKYEDTKSISLSYRKEVICSKYISVIQKICYFIYSLNPKLYIKLLEIFNN